MRYGNYGTRGRYMGDYGRRGRGYGYLDDMAEQYGNYNESRENYRGKESIKSLDYMLKSVCQFMKMLKEDADSPEEMELIREYSRKLGDI